MRKTARCGKIIIVKKKDKGKRTEGKMNAVLERSTVENVEKEQHNAMISERYRKLLDAVEDQFSTPVVEKNEYAPTVLAPKAPVLEETPILEQAPTVTEYSPVFTTEKFERIEQFNEAQVRPVANVQEKAIVKAAPTAVAHYSLTPLAKVAMAVFTMVVVAMLVLIGINSQLMSQRRIRIKNLEEQREELIERNEEIQRRIQELQTEESIIQRAEQAGLLN